MDESLSRQQKTILEKSEKNNESLGNDDMGTKPRASDSIEKSDRKNTMNQSTEKAFWQFVIL